MSRRARVLVVDDAEDARLLYGQVLATTFDCETASNGEEALARLRHDAFDAIVLDLSMPVMDGWAVLDVLRSDDTLGGVAAVVLSASFDEETELRARALGAVAYVAKPVGNRDLLHVVERALEGRGDV